MVQKIEAGGIADMNRDVESEIEKQGLENVDVLRSVLQEYYGRRFQTSSDFVQGACCTDDTKRRFSDILEMIPDEVKARHYGCGCPIPEDDLTGLRVLDLGCGSGVDVFVLSRLVGPSGSVFGIDMTEEQLEIGRNHVSTVMKRFGNSGNNVSFAHDFIEVAETIPDHSIDLVVSSCVINLSPRKDLVLRAIRRVLKDGGEFHISDIVADRRVPRTIREDPGMVAECLGGAEYEHDWLDLIRDSGCLDPRVVRRVEVSRDVLGEPIVFHSLTLRGFHFAERLDRRCEDYGQIATYLGSVAQQKARFVFDDHHVFEAGRPTPVCRNTARMLSETRLSSHFQVTPPLRHFGLFECSPNTSAQAVASSGCC